jgi:8-oxo-dGTP diphosphatase
MKLGVVALVFRCRVVGGTASETAEAAAIGWLTPAEVVDHMTEAFAIRVQDALNGPWPHVREHDGMPLIDTRNEA